MNKELTEQITTKYPSLFRGKDLSISENLMPFECEHGDGWYQIMDDLCGEIMNVLEKDEELKESFMFVQVKEKFGTIRVYCSTYNDGIKYLIEEAEKRSYSTCEECGNPGKNRTDRFWIQTLCDEHALNCSKY